VSIMRHLDVSLFIPQMAYRINISFQRFSGLCFFSRFVNRGGCDKTI